ncbi:MAG: type II toxin-antitoxin system VapC family toxin [Terracidiphilus sp.]
MISAVAYLLDTNVLSETRRKKADSGVMAFLEATDSSALYLSVFTLCELRKGIATKRRTDLTAARALAGWVEGLEFGFTNRILGIDATTARLWGDWSNDRPRPVIDTLLAATAAEHGLTLVTRNTRDISGLAVKVHNPWAG